MDKYTESFAIKRYLTLMHELATRLDLINLACDGKLNLTPPYAREYTYLQFRRICELLALGSLEIHGELPATKTKSARKEWHAEKIMSLLHDNHPNAFPQSVIRTKTQNVWTFNANAKPNALTRDEFKKLYNECGEVLHRGTIKSLEESGGISEHHYKAVTNWQSKIIDLLNEHLIVKHNQKSFFLISLRVHSGYPEASKYTPKRDGTMDIEIFKIKH